MSEQAQPWDDWTEELIRHAAGYSTKLSRNIATSLFMYETYYEDGLTPEEAFEEEWG